MSEPKFLSIGNRFRLRDEIGGVTVHPLVVGLSGGEPTLNPKLPDII